MKDVLDIPSSLAKEQIASLVGDFWDTNNQERQIALDRSQDIRDYLAADTTLNTEVGSLPWKNKTTIPKLTQLFDSLRSYYAAAIMPSDDWFVWEGSNKESLKKADVIEEYLRAKVRESNTEDVILDAIADWIMYGFCFATVEWIESPSYTGPQPRRISPLDAMINPRARSFNSSPFINRAVVHISEIMSNGEFDQEALSKVKNIRAGSRDYDYTEFYKDRSVFVDGFQTFNDYFESGYVELLEYYGPVYDDERGEFLGDRHVVVADRAYVLYNSETPVKSFRKPIVYATWRKLPENLLGNGPFHQLVGMQYRCDHLENLKADAFDLIIHPMLKVKGEQVEEFEYGPGQRIYVGADSDVEPMSPDTSVLLCDNQIAQYHRMMEEFAGSPREMMGFRTPGEKTAFEVNVLQQGADRLFLDKARQFENSFIRPMLQLMFELTINNMPVEDVVRVFNDETQTTTFMTITKKDVEAQGTLRPIGSRHYEQRNKRVLELQNFAQIMESMPSLRNHFSGKNTAAMLEEELGYAKYNLVDENVAIYEQFAAQALVQNLQQMAQNEANSPDEEGMGAAGNAGPQL